MVDLFVDIETVPDMSREEYFSTKQEVDSGLLTRNSDDRDRYWKFERGGLMPFSGRVILITYQVNNANVHRLMEWEDGEEVILRKYYDLLRDLQWGSSDDRLKIIGHNILGFDLFFLYNRMLEYDIDEPWRLYQWTMNKPQVIDFLQMHLPLNGFNAKGLRHDVLAHAYELPTKETLGSEEIKHYYMGEYDKILGYSEREFVYPEMYSRISAGGLVSEQRLQESIQWYQDLISNTDA